MKINKKSGTLPPNLSKLQLNIVNLYYFVFNYLYKSFYVKFVAISLTLMHRTYPYFLKLYL
jgi:hypothetical protein